MLFHLIMENPTQTIKKARYHDAVYDTCYLILFWKIPHKWPKKDRYHDAVNHTCDNTSLVKCLHTFAQKKVQYHNAVNPGHRLLILINRNHVFYLIFFKSTDIDFFNRVC